MNVEQVMRLAPVVPVLVIEDVAHAAPIAEALVKGGLKALEVTLRTPAALDVIREMSKVEGAVVGAGTVLNPKQLDAALEAGATFIVSPGLTEPLAKAAIAAGTAFLPGTATAADIMRGLDLGLTHFKFFPAETSGGLKALKALAAPLLQARFCPTGGITVATAPDWLAFDPVLCVGGSWVVPAGAPDVALIEARAKEAAALGR
ncbi:bifunctional 4-hydroxy-2-oxoglutarate aldolase/2-dehydro-3-deoxy-phosphogluconate aldolase [Sphingomonas sanxanigenens]|uniref:2-dehydro-3-deoxy-phosphogluconate aldolase n=1 Tax=Sphingomonas sanxanigenens DSM 19645 = NX02 TaxID=1123269 RepID=W0A5T0_9SPHN|nr:bifunctional 4-hydroxy-2-oxoglutarate aldolase/2-dehydro-3-deoxy-phosphogluconate aldolase [Sphingomonas sanxanigenens]AHE52411.1 ketohydroxyglutarate aldolase [Sphingomonas sanxanigenens DSM 19645 = NX02]